MFLTPAFFNNTRNDFKVKLDYLLLEYLLNILLNISL